MCTGCGIYAGEADGHEQDSNRCPMSTRAARSLGAVAAQEALTEHGETSYSSETGDQ